MCGFFGSRRDTHITWRMCRRRRWRRSMTTSWWGWRHGVPDGHNAGGPGWRPRASARVRRCARRVSGARHRGRVRHDARAGRPFPRVRRAYIGFSSESGVTNMHARVPGGSTAINAGFYSHAHPGWFHGQEEVTGNFVMHPKMITAELTTSTFLCHMETFFN